MKKVLALILTLGLALSCLISGSVAFASDYALIRYIPTKLTVSDEEVAVEGCFVNMNKSGTLTGFQNFCMFSCYRNTSRPQPDAREPLRHCCTRPKDLTRPPRAVGLIFFLLNAIIPS